MYIYRYKEKHKNKYKFYIRFIIKIKNKRENYYFEEMGGTFFTFIRKFKNINSFDLYGDSLNEHKDKLIKLIFKQPYIKNYLEL